MQQLGQITLPVDVAMSNTYDLGLVTLSIIVAVFASYTILGLAGRVTAAYGWSRFAWLIGGAIIMGIGIRSMHFVGMLALSLPIPIAYDVWLVVLSVLPVIIASGLALSLVSGRVLSIQKLFTGGLLMGIGIACMHYFGMGAMQVKATSEYDPALFVVSVAIAQLSESSQPIVKFLKDTNQALNQLDDTAQLLKRMISSSTAS